MAAPVAGAPARAWVPLSVWPSRPRAASPATAVVLVPAAWDTLAAPLLRAAAGRAERLVVLDVLAPPRPRWAPAGRPVPTVEDRWAGRLDDLRRAVRAAGPARRAVVAVEVHCGDPVWAVRDAVLTHGATEVVVPGGHDELVADLVRQLPVPVSALSGAVAVGGRS